VYCATLDGKYGQTHQDCFKLNMPKPAEIETCELPHCPAATLAPGLADGDVDVRLILKADAGIVDSKAVVQRLSSMFSQGLQFSTPTTTVTTIPAAADESGVLLATLIIFTIMGAGPTLIQPAQVARRFTTMKMIEGYEVLAVEFEQAAPKMAAAVRGEYKLDEQWCTAEKNPCRAPQVSFDLHATCLNRAHTEVDLHLCDAPITLKQQTICDRCSQDLASHRSAIISAAASQPLNTQSGTTSSIIGAAATGGMLILVAVAILAIHRRKAAAPQIQSDKFLFLADALFGTEDHLGESHMENDQADLSHSMQRVIALHDVNDHPSSTDNAVAVAGRDGAQTAGSVAAPIIVTQILGPEVSVKDRDRSILV
jgi:hypothetical protein